MGSTQPYYRRTKPSPQQEGDFQREVSLNWVIQRLQKNHTIPERTAVTGRYLVSHFLPSPSGSLRFALSKMLVKSGLTPHVDLANAHIDPYGSVTSPGFDAIAETNRLFDKRAAASIYAVVNPTRGVRIFPNIKWAPGPGLAAAAVLPYHIDDDTAVRNPIPVKQLYSDMDLLELKFYGDAAPRVFVPLFKCLAAMAYQDYFPTTTFQDFAPMVSEALLAAGPGWCGTFGPGVETLDDVIGGDVPEGNYDMSQMHLLPLAYRYFDKLTDSAREYLVRVLLATGRIHRPLLNDIATSGSAPNDWSRAGLITGDKFRIIDPVGLHINIGETENHILTIHTARYLTNQLLYQRDHDPNHDNRRNGADGVPTCTELMLILLRNILRDDFSEYNAKPYQNETRAALLNLCSYAYDHEVRLAARMALDYVAAHVVVSSNDLRRMVPFRRRNEGEFVWHTTDGFMTIGLLEQARGADPNAEHFAMLAGNTRAYESPYEAAPNIDRPWSWSIASGGGDATQEALSDYRLPPSIHDLFVNDHHRRFFQRLHRTPQDNIEVTGRNADNMEIYAGSPSYLITAGGGPAPHAVNPSLAALLAPGGQAKQLGVAVPTSFIPTGAAAGYVFGNDSAHDLQNDATQIIQLSSFSDKLGELANYGVAPDFACGLQGRFPNWCVHPRNGANDVKGGFRFVDCGSNGAGPGFYLAIFANGNSFTLEAYDTWLHRDGLTFEQFKANVWAANSNLDLVTNVEASYTTQNGNCLRFLIWDDGDNNHSRSAIRGARISNIEYGDPLDSIGDASDADRFLSGTVLNSAAEGVIEITNHLFNGGTKLTLDMQDLWHPRRTDESGAVEQAGFNNEAWVDFDWKGQTEGDFFHPFNTIAGAVAAVAAGGTVKIMPGQTQERISILNKRMTLSAPVGGVRLGAR